MLMGRHVVATEPHDLGLLDAKRRKIGAVLQHIEYEVADFVDAHGYVPNPYFEGVAVGTRVRFICLQAARDGDRFGACQPEIYVGRVDDPNTEAKAAAHVHRRLSAMRRRYERRAGRKVKEDTLLRADEVRQAALDVADTDRWVAEAVTQQGTPLRGNETADVEALVEVRARISRTSDLHREAEARLREGLRKLAGLVAHALATGEIVGLHEAVGAVVRAEQDEAVYSAELALLAKLARVQERLVGEKGS